MHYMRDTYQSITRVRTMATFVRFGACMQSHVSPQVRTEFRLKIASVVSAGVSLDILRVGRIFVPPSMPGINIITLNENNNQ